MRFLARQSITSYAVSTRGHGESWRPSFLRMLYAATKRDLADDIVAGINAVEKIEGSEVGSPCVGHSSGGGLSQFILSEGDVQVQGLALLGAVPGNGSQNYPEDKLLDFQSHMSRYESFIWPLGMMLSFLDGKKLLRNILG
ncbi:hypothetical protein F4809DRAFT_640666 [Biscogniauxia mediterranea]|nr:hypothetical protein F4809DRAFT_640666 [Biscogniauxia mediterranea]